MSAPELLPAQRLLRGRASGPVVFAAEALSFWGGVDPATGRVIDARHPLRGRDLAGCILMMATSRGSCSGSGVLLDLALQGRAPAALLFRQSEDVLTLGALAASEMFGKSLPVLRLPEATFRAFAASTRLEIDEDRITAEELSAEIVPAEAQTFELTSSDRALLDGVEGPAAALAMRMLRSMALQQGASRFVDVARAHIDGCIYASPANLIFAERLADLGARARIPTTMNAISVDRAHWRKQGVDPAFGAPAARLADAYVRMGCRPTFTCAPYLLDDPPRAGEVVGWAESNAVVFANSVLGARTAKHPDFLDLCIALTGRAPLAGVYIEAERRARRVIDVERPAGADESFWPLLGYLAGRASPDRVPLLRGLADAAPTRDDLKALCAAFGTTSAAPMLHIDGVTPEAALPPAPDADGVAITYSDLAAGWAALDAGPERVDLVAIGSPHASLTECRALAERLAGRRAERAPILLTAGRDVIAAAEREGVAARLRDSGVRILPDLCWCSISEPVYPPTARNVMTNSGKYAHYGPGLHGRTVRFASLAGCVEAAVTGRAATGLPRWLA